jgi:hypothetical protein
MNSPGTLEQVEADVRTLSPQEQAQLRGWPKMTRYYWKVCGKTDAPSASYDRATLPRHLAKRIAGGKDHAGVIFVDQERFPVTRIGDMARGLQEFGNVFQLLSSRFQFVSFPRLAW